VKERKTRGPRGKYHIRKPATPNLHVLSLGWGVQSYTIAEMSLAARRGCACELCTAWDLAPLASITQAIHSDTTYERAATYDFAARRTPALEAGGLHVVVLSPKRHPKILYRSGAKGTAGGYTLIPVYTFDKENKRTKSTRACTKEWKIDTVQQYLLRWFRARGIPKPERLVHLTIGISYDEWIRMKQSEKTWIEHHYPLVDRKITRDDCARWLIAHDLEVPQKSSCIMCPFHRYADWVKMKAEEPAEFDRAVAIDRELRSDGKPRFIHQSYRPLEERVGDLNIPLVQTSLFGDETEDETEDGSCDSGFCFS
jgi:hypothetical protein